MPRKSQVKKVVDAANEVKKTNKGSDGAAFKRACATYARAWQNASPEERAESERQR